ncbi:AT hook-like [Ostreococcus tauri]|uniref:AT hook-like n=1 Tax=Ostreococcus tauri TaxID=70448 RepID=A0A090M6K7_OSTTA|nr:AT hook-like [Ostreococcus tauri]CEF99836.1 AT hook-like [Ostreococcus tauri]|eukprot:XP_022840063.1 AT hook-like [Ostreococcus tauri]
MQKSTKAFTKEPEARERKTRKESTDGAKTTERAATGRTPVRATTTPEKDDEKLGKGRSTRTPEKDAPKRGRGRPAGTTAAVMAKRNAEKDKAGKAGVSRKVSAMAKAAAIAKEGLKRPAKYFESQERSDAGRNKVSKLASVSSPRSTMDSPEFARGMKTPGVRTPPRGRGRPPSKLGKAAAAATDAANRANGLLHVDETHMPQSTAWSGAYRMLQSAHERLQAKYDQLKSKKLEDLMKEAERQQGVLMDHERRADELVHHLRNEADRQRDIASRAEGANEKVYALERENAELRETALAYQGKMLRMEEELETLRTGSGTRAGGRDDGFSAYQLEALTGLRWQEKTRGVHTFTHIGTGFTFRLSAAEGEDGESSGDDPLGAPKPGRRVAEEVACVPLGFGNIEGFVPSFLAEPMEFDTTDIPVFTYKLLQALHTASLQRAGAQR